VAAARSLCARKRLPWGPAAEIAGALLGLIAQRFLRFLLVSFRFEPRSHSHILEAGRVQLAVKPTTLW
jgi:hypothetical protein